MERRARRFCGTCNNYKEENIEALKSLKYHYILIGDEVSKSGTPHLQWYVWLRNASTLKALIKKLPGCHCIICDGTNDDNTVYCTKEKVLFEDGECPKQGKRSDIEIMRDTLQTTGSMREVCKVATSYQSLRMAEIILTYTERKRTWKPEVKWYYGATGTGKTRTAYEELGEDVYSCGITSQWFQGYDAHENVIVDDFRKDFIKFHDILKFVDRYAYSVPCKGGSRQFLAKKIIITSPYHPNVVYEGREDMNQLIRRIDVIKEFKGNNAYWEQNAKELQEAKRKANVLEESDEEDEYAHKAVKTSQDFDDAETSSE